MGQAAPAVPAPAVAVLDAGPGLPGPAVAQRRRGRGRPSSRKQKPVLVDECLQRVAAASEKIANATVGLLEMFLV